MSAALAIAPAPWTTVDTLFPARPAPVRTLDDLISTVCDDLAGSRTVACPVCHGPMAPRASAVGPSGGRCGDCDSTLG